MTETAAVEPVRFRRPALASSGRLGSLVRGTVLACGLGLADDAAAAPVTVGVGLGYDVPAVPIANALTIDRGDSLGVALTLPVLVGGLRLEPQLTWTSLGHAYGTPPPGSYPDCPGLMACTVETVETQRVVAGLTIGPSWSVGDRGRLWVGPWGGTTFRWSGDAVYQDWSLGANLGGEWFLQPDRFSFGLDLRATYTSVEAGGTQTTSTSYGRWGWQSYNDFDRGWTADFDAVAAFRLYLN